jgi:type VI secretion system (T6SS) effector Hcp
VIFFIARGNGQETTMRNPILAITIAFVLAAPCTALAGEKNKEKYIELQGYNQGVNNAGSTGKVTHKPVTVIKQTDSASPLLMNKTVGGSTGPTKPPLPTTGTQHR